MRRVLVFLVCTTIGIFGYPSTGSAAGLPPSPGGSTWMDHDTAVYVVSTLNLLRTPRGHSSTRLLVRKMHATHVEVWKDLKVDGLFFIEFKRDDSSIVGALAYEMGWTKPAGVLPIMDRFGVTPAPAAVVKAFKIDPTRLLESFGSSRRRR
jgi:hypothetical protein